jgi:hypothetical protein
MASNKRQFSVDANDGKAKSGWSGLGRQGEA